MLVETDKRPAVSASFGELIKNADFQLSLPGLLIQDVCHEA